MLIYVLSDAFPYISVYRHRGLVETKVKRPGVSKRYWLLYPNALEEILLINCRFFGTVRVLNTSVLAISYFCSPALFSLSSLIKMSHGELFTKTCYWRLLHVYIHQLFTVDGCHANVWVGCDINSI